MQAPTKNLKVKRTNQDCPPMDTCILPGRSSLNSDGPFYRIGYINYESQPFFSIHQIMTTPKTDPIYIHAGEKRENKKELEDLGPK